MGELGGSLGGAPDLLDVVSSGHVGRERLQGEIAIPKNRREQIVEVMRDAAGKAAHRLHLL